MGIYHAYSLVESILAAQGGDSDILAAIFGVKAEYLEESFDEMQKRYGAIENYFAEVLGIHAARQKALRDQEVGKFAQDQENTVASMETMLVEARNAALAYTHLSIDDLHDLAERINIELMKRRRSG